MQWIGYVGAAAFGLAWIPQSIETIRAKHCGANPAFLLLSAVGSISLTIYAWQKADVIFMAINTLTSAGALLNAYYKLRPGASCP